MQTLSLSEFQSRCTILLKLVEEIGENLLITENGNPIIRITPYEENTTTQHTQRILSMLHGNIQHYDTPQEPVGESDWESLQN